MGVFYENLSTFEFLLFYVWMVQRLHCNLFTMSFICMISYSALTKVFNVVQVLNSLYGMWKIKSLDSRTSHIAYTVVGVNNADRQVCDSEFHGRGSRWKR